MAIKLEKNELVGIVERRDKEGKVFTEKIILFLKLEHQLNGLKKQFDIISTEDIKKINPWILVDFYESKISFDK